MLAPLSGAFAAMPTGDGPSPIRTRIGGADTGSGLPGGRTAAAPFADTLRGLVAHADGAHKAAEAEVEAFVAGEAENVHDAMIAVNQAELQFQLLTEVRNKLLDSYQELMRMQV